MNPSRERALLVHAEQDLAALEEIYEHYFPRVYAYVSYRVNTVQDAEDLVATTFLKVAEKLRQFHWRGDGSFSAWMFRIAHDLVIDYYRRNRGVSFEKSFDELPDLESNALLPDDATMRKERFAFLRQLIATLSPRRQEIITLRFFAGLRNREIAGILGLDERTVASHLCRGLEDLHDKFVNEVDRQMKERIHEQ